MNISERLLLEFDREMAKARKLLECAPEERFDWHPPGQVMKLRCLVSSMADLPTRITAALDQSSLNVTRVDSSGSAATLAPSSGTRYLEIFASNVHEARDRIVEASDERLLARLTFELNGKAILSMPREAVIRHVVLGRLRWQRALLAMYLQIARVAIDPSRDKTQGCNSVRSSECHQA
jgi:hypothetical protein